MGDNLKVICSDYCAAFRLNCFTLNSLRQFVAIKGPDGGLTHGKNSELFQCCAFTQHHWRFDSRKSLKTTQCPSLCKCLTGNCWKYIFGNGDVIERPNLVTSPASETQTTMQQWQNNNNNNDRQQLCVTTNKDDQPSFNKPPQLWSDFCTCCLMDILEWWSPNERLQSDHNMARKWNTFPCNSDDIKTHYNKMSISTTKRGIISNHRCILDTRFFFLTLISHFKPFCWNKKSHAFVFMSILIDCVINSFHHAHYCIIWAAGWSLAVAAPSVVQRVAD